MKIPSESHKTPAHKETAKVQKGDVDREFIESSDVINTFIRPIDMNKKNGVSRLHKAPAKDSYKGYFKGAKVVREPAAGDAHLAALRIFRSIAKKGGYSGGGMPPNKNPRKI